MTHNCVKRFGDPAGELGDAKRRRIPRNANIRIVSELRRFALTRSDLRRYVARCGLERYKANWRRLPRRAVP